MASFFFKLLMPLLSIFGFSQKKCKRFYVDAKRITYDVVIVPGVPYKGVKWDTIMKGRVYWAKHLYDSGIARHIIFSGSSVYTPWYEGKIMALYANAIGIPDSVLFTELKAEHSTENIYYSWKKCRNLGFEKIALATDPFQSKQLHKFIQHKTPGVALIPFVIQILKEVNKLDVAVADTLAYNPAFVSIKKRESRKMRRRGTMGKNISESYYADGKLE